MISDGELQVFYAPPTQSPWVRAVFVSSLDGSATGAQGRSGDLGGTLDSRAFAATRAGADLIIVGAETARTERYRAADAPCPMAIVSRTLDIPVNAVDDGTIVVTTAAASRSQRERWANHRIVESPGDSIDWLVTLAQLSSWGFSTISCEGGPRLFADMVAADVIDEVCLNIAGSLVLGEGPRIGHGPIIDPLHFALAGHIASPEVLLTRWHRTRPSLDPAD